MPFGSIPAKISLTYPWITSCCGPLGLNSDGGAGSAVAGVAGSSPRSSSIGVIGTDLGDGDDEGRVGSDIGAAGDISPCAANLSTISPW
jgi:hypothetical protein